MRLNGLFSAAAAALMVAAIAAPAYAGDPSGVWLRDPNGPGQVGQQVFFGMGQAGPNRWTGSAHNPEDGRDYDGSMTLSGNHLVTQGCALGGMICKTVNWTCSR